MGFLLLLPFFLVRFGLMSCLDRDAVKRAAHFAPMEGREKAAYWTYQLSNAAILIFLLFLPVKLAPLGLFAAGAAVYLLGLILLTISVVNFAAPTKNGIHTNGLYRVSRNPMYVAYFFFFAGCALVVQSPVLLALVLVFQVSAHWIILAEERWCAREFGREYLQYQQKVRRYF